MIIINTTMINAVYLDQYTIIDESSMINDDFGNFSKPICRWHILQLSYCKLGSSSISRTIKFNLSYAEYNLFFKRTVADNVLT